MAAPCAVPKMNWVDATLLAALAADPDARRRVAGIQRCERPNPVPSIPDESSLRELQGLIERAGLRREADAFILDDIGLLTTPYVAWQTRLHPRAICRTGNAVNVPFTARQLRTFLLHNREGVVVATRTSTLTASLQQESDCGASLAGEPLSLTRVGEMQWESANRSRQFGTLTVARYRVDMEGELAGPPPACMRSFPIALCR